MNNEQDRWFKITSMIILIMLVILILMINFTIISATVDINHQIDQTSQSLNVLEGKIDDLPDHISNTLNSAIDDIANDYNQE